MARLRWELAKSRPEVGHIPPKGPQATWASSVGWVNGGRRNILFIHSACFNESFPACSYLLVALCDRPSNDAQYFLTTDWSITDTI